MSDRRTERGPHPKDAACFAATAVPLLRAAVDDLTWLLSRGYSRGAAHRLVGERYALRDRQRQALQRCAAAPLVCKERRDKCQSPAKSRGEVLLVDGFNVLLSVEAALSGGLLLLCRDGTLRDLAAMNRNYRQVRTTRPALEAIGRFLAEQRSGPVTWLLDRPIRGGGRLHALIDELASERGWEWRVRRVPNPDPLLSASPRLVATADSAVLDRCARWLNLARLVVEAAVPDAWILEL